MTEPRAQEGQPNPIGGNGRSRHCGWEPTLRVVAGANLVTGATDRLGYQCPICGLRGHLGDNAAEAAAGWERLKPASEKES